MHINVNCPKPLHLPSKRPLPKGKKLMPAKQRKTLFSGRIRIEEKMDGRLASHKKGNFLFFSTDLLVKRTVAYSVPGRFAVLDIFDKRSKTFLSQDDGMRLMLDLLKNPNYLPEEHQRDGVFQVPVFNTGKFSEEEVINLSFPASVHANEGAVAGLVIKRAGSCSLQEYLSAQIVRPGFYKKKRETGASNLVDFNLVLPPQQFIREVMAL